MIKLETSYSSTNDEKGEAILLKRWNLFSIVYVIFLIFVLAQIILGQFGLSFTPFLWNTWAFFLAMTLWVHFWYRYYKNSSYKKSRFVLEILSALFVFCAWFLTLLSFSFIEDSRVPITIDSEFESNQIVITRGSLLHGYHEYHDLLNPWIMKAEVKYKREY